MPSNEYVAPTTDELLKDVRRLERRATRKIKLAKFKLFPALLAGDSVGDVTLDGRMALVQSHPDGCLCLCPLKPNPQPSEQEAWFYSDCISYEHDIPVVVYPRPGDFVRFKYRYAYVEPQRNRTVSTVHIPGGVVTKGTVRPLTALKAVKQYYTEQWLTILTEICSLNLGPLTCVLFRSPGFGKTVDLPYSNRYQRVRTEIHLYATALRQADALSEYLCYYRVIEGATNSNGVNWITAALDLISRHDFGLIQICNVDGEPEPKSLMKIYLRRASLRLKELMHIFHTSHGVAQYLYKVDRCGIAHGREIRKSDVTPKYFEILKDTYIVKMLARIAIDQRVA
jgi:hypothetical protein